MGDLNFTSLNTVISLRTGGLKQEIKDRDMSYYSYNNNNNIINLHNCVCIREINNKCYIISKKFIEFWKDTTGREIAKVKLKKSGGSNMYLDIPERINIKSKLTNWYNKTISQIFTLPDTVRLNKDYALFIQYIVLNAFSILLNKSVIYELVNDLYRHLSIVSINKSEYINDWYYNPENILLIKIFAIFDYFKTFENLTLPRSKFNSLHLYFYYTNIYKGMDIYKIFDNKNIIIFFFSLEEGTSIDFRNIGFSDVYMSIIYKLISDDTTGSEIPPININSPIYKIKKLINQLQT